MLGTESRLIKDILGQSASLAQVLNQHGGKGYSRILEATALVRSAREIILVGVGASLNAAILLEKMLGAQGLPAHAVEAGEFLHYASINHDDVVIILVSRSGESIEITKILSALKNRRQIIGITSEPGSTLGLQASITLEVNNLADELVAIQSYSGTLTTSYLLGPAIAGELSAALTEIEHLLPAFEAWVSDCLQAYLHSRSRAFLLFGATRCIAI